MMDAVDCCVPEMQQRDYHLGTFVCSHNNNNNITNSNNTSSYKKCNTKSINSYYSNNNNNSIDDKASSNNTSTNSCKINNKNSHKYNSNTSNPFSSDKTSCGNIQKSNNIKTTTNTTTTNNNNNIKNMKTTSCSNGNNIDCSTNSSNDQSEPAAHQCQHHQHHHHHQRHRHCIQHPRRHLLHHRHRCCSAIGLQASGSCSPAWARREGDGLVFLLVVVIIAVIVNGHACLGYQPTLETGQPEGTITPQMSVNCNMEGSFRCDPSIDLCVHGSSKCDGEVNCPNGHDESVETCGCLSTEFQCNASTCIDLLQRCDGTEDCLEGNDEEGCETYICPLTHEKCDNSVCVPRDKRCDFYNDCGDSSDEANCARRQCFLTEFTCNNSQCVSMAFLCDGQRDCLDGSDEVQAECEKHFKCPIGYYVQNSVKCDGWVDCMFTHADELQCGQCQRDQYRCPNGQCIRHSSVCDGTCDCLACEDEDTCETYGCLLGQRFLCHPSYDFPGKCIPRDSVCDGHNDCLSSQHGWDEYYCTDASNCSRYNTGSRQYFMCPGEHRCLETRFLCDGYADCLNGLDEKDCDTPSCSPAQFTCHNAQCVDQAKRCDTVFDCKDRSDEVGCASVPCGAGSRRCESGHCLHRSKWCDYIRDCPDGSDERNCAHRSCGLGQFRCNSGQCVDAASVCYGGNDQSLEGCQDSSHLLNCSKHTCRAGEFRCGVSGYCIEQSQVCDSSVDCKYSNSDEQKCVFRCPQQDRKCACRVDAMNCEGLGLDRMPYLEEDEHLSKLSFQGNTLRLTDATFASSYYYKVTYLDLSNNSLTYIPPNAFVNLWRLTQLGLSNNQLTELTTEVFTGLSSLRQLHLYGNKIRTIGQEVFLPLINLVALDLSSQELVNISKNTFKGLKRVLTLNLSGNAIHYVQRGAFNGLDKLIAMDLSGNKITVLASGLFSGLGVLQTLMLQGNLIQEMDDGVFGPLTSLNFLHTDSYKFCCLAREGVHCLPEADEFSSCKDLMSNQVLRVSIWVLGLVALLGNAVVICWRMRDCRGGRVHSFLITNLALGDLLMGVYLLIIAAVDTHYRGVYIIHDQAWRQSDLCRFAGFLSTFSSELSVLTLTTITMDRLICILFPLKRTRLGIRQAFVVMATMWIFVFLVGMTPLFGFSYFQNFYGRSGVCLALHVTPDRPPGWQYSVAVFLVLNFFSFLLIAVSYLWMFAVAKKSRSAVRTPESRNDNAMARRMTVIVMTDFCCWIPIIVLGFVSLAGVRANNQVYAWIAVFVLPLNSATNPLLYTLSTAPFLGNVRKRVARFRKSFINSITVDTKHSYVEDRTSNSFVDRKSPYRQLELRRLQSLNSSPLRCIHEAGLDS